MLHQPLFWLKDMIQRPENQAEPWHRFPSTDFVSAEHPQTDVPCRRALARCQASLRSGNSSTRGRSFFFFFSVTTPQKQTSFFSKCRKSLLLNQLSGVKGNGVYCHIKEKLMSSNIWDKTSPALTVQSLFCLSKLWEGSMKEKGECPKKAEMIFFLCSQAQVQQGTYTLNKFKHIRTLASNSLIPS